MAGVIEVYSETWRVVAAWAAAEIEVARGKLEQRLSVEDAEHQRARLKVLRELLALQAADKPTPPLNVSPSYVR